jgi:hypothetical protein
VGLGGTEGWWRYHRAMASLEWDREALANARPVRTLEELVLTVQTGLPPTADDVMVTLDGRRLDTKEKVIAWVDEVNAARAAELGS